MVSMGSFSVVPVAAWEKVIADEFPWRPGGGERLPDLVASAYVEAAVTGLVVGFSGSGASKGMGRREPMVGNSFVLFGGTFRRPG